MDNRSRLPSQWMVFISLLQGLGLLYLHQAIELDYWLHHQPQWLFAFYSFVLIWPTMLLLGLEQSRWRSIVKLTLPFAVLAALLGFYVGYQATPVEQVRYDALLFGYVLTMTIATYKVLMYCQQLAAAQRITYSALFLWSWRNFLTLALALLFAGSVWLILLLWGLLFEAIEIDFFMDLFQERWFYYPILALTNGFGIIIFRNLTGVIDTITRLQQALMKFLLVILVLVALLFLSALPFTGLHPLWNSGGSSLILWMQALILFFVNAVYQDEPDSWPYQLWLHRFIYIGIVVLPIYSAISFYGLSLRVEQYGWSLSRCWAYLVWLLLALFPLGYCWGIARYRDHWVRRLSPVNITMSLIVLIIMLLVNSPLLDFRKFVSHDQLQRLADHRISIESFDISYFRRHLARPGYEGLQILREQYGDQHPELVVRIDALYASPADKTPSSSREEFVAAIQQYAEHPPPALLDTLFNDAMADKWRLQQTIQYYLKALDVNGDDRPEYLWIGQRPSYLDIVLYYLDGDQWHSMQVISSWYEEADVQALISAIERGEIGAAPPVWQDIKIGDRRFRVDSRN